MNGEAEICQLPGIKPSGRASTSRRAGSEAPTQQPEWTPCPHKIAQTSPPPADRGPVALSAAAIPAAMALFLYSGVYNIGADVPHTKPVFWLISQFRDRSVAPSAPRRSHRPRTLTAPARIATGAVLYDSLCTSCHLAPGMKKTDLSRGLYPRRRSSLRHRPYAGPGILDHQAWHQAHRDAGLGPHP